MTDEQNPDIRQRVGNRPLGIDHDLNYRHIVAVIALLFRWE